MQEFLSRLVGKKVDVACVGTASLRGEIVKVEAGILHLRDEEQHLAFVAIDKIAIVWEVRENEHRAGFVSGAVNNR